MLESHGDIQQMFHESSCFVNNYEREPMIELMLVEIETKGCTESIAGIHEQVTGSRLCSEGKNCCW